LNAFGGSGALADARHQDPEVLNFKKHLSRPRLRAQDGPVHAYRRYAEAYCAGLIPRHDAVAEFGPA